MNYKQYFEKAQQASRTMVSLAKETINTVLTDVAAALVVNADKILTENAKDLARMPIEDPKYDRLKLSKERIADIANDLKNVAGLNSPLGKVLSDKILDNQLHIQKVSVPLGVVGVIYEARPNVTADVFSLCFKTGNVAVLKGGSDAELSNLAITKIIHGVLDDHAISRDVLTLLPAERTATEALLNARGFVDVLIPRGSQSLINYVRENSKIPVIETGAGIVHTYFDESGDLGKGKAIIFNAKTRRVSVCNSLDCVLINENRLNDLSALLSPLADGNVELFADEKSYAALQATYPASLLNQATPEHFGTEFLSLKLAVKMVNNLNEALNHIATYSSKHSEAIISEDAANIARFLNEVDAAAVYANASTGFTDGAQFGLGAEIGISTQKLHARGPMGLEELTSYKWVVRGDGQIRG
ncbi:glutamate-5-semialdehyde dehydrogenase [Pedobacter sp. HDW13]|uniref:glutamate-5-semialdehyde dehydrogenase n=1 Tax=unclassified Pedobacter TaxID=2628915 RepID=UPI000F58FE13|nr:MULTISPECIES: glutamate-5-semialdehyde dehydrogenase [unclassified Pedobacter]QIL39443.1 glutamate-5-semialdehyde dehydrogenase [Pedobacter sp. HDW13]RQO78672.1 glutamate-5-semialdehyde dehydrogenase [Pedobacter sp. KBW01]